MNESAPEQRWIIQFKDGVSRQKRSYHLCKCKGRNRSRVGYRTKRKPNYRYTHYYGDLSQADIDRMMRSGDIEYIEEVKQVPLLAMPNDPHFDKQWSLNHTIELWHYIIEKMIATEGHINAVSAWDSITSADDVVIAVVDTGVEYTHPDLNANMWTDQYGNYGYTFSRDYRAVNAPPALHHGSGIKAYHGTHVAGIIGAVGNNNLGVSGVLQSCQIMPINIFWGYWDEVKGSVNWTTDYADAADAVYYAVDNGAHIINHSWGGEAEPPRILTEAWEYAEQNGVICVCASGNHRANNDYGLHYPSNYIMRNNFAVNSNGFFGNMSEFTCYGLMHTDIYAPGGDGSLYPNDYNILSTMLNSQYGYAFGTSMATPVVSAVLGAIKQLKPSLSMEDMRKVLYRSMRPYKDMFFTCQSGGMVDLDRVVRHLRAGHGYDLESVSDVDVEVEITIPYDHYIKWTEPDGPDLYRVIISRQEWQFPRNDYGSEDGTTFDTYVTGYTDHIETDLFDEYVEIVYNGTGTTSLRLESERDTVYGYKIETWYKPDPGKEEYRQALPVYVRSYTGYTPFICPREPNEFGMPPVVQFICDFWDEEWIGFKNRSFKDPFPLAQIWRAITSKNITARRDEFHKFGQGRNYEESFSFRPGALFKHYFPFHGFDRDDWDPRNKVPKHPTGVHINYNSTVKDVAIFISELVTHIKRHMRGFSLPSYVGASGNMRTFRWIDYYKYMYEGALTVYIPPDIIWDWDEAYIKKPCNWQKILRTCQDILNNMRVLYTATPPFWVGLDKIRHQRARSVPGTVSGITYKEEQFPLPWHSSVTDEGYTVPVPPASEYFYINRSGIIGGLEWLLAGVRSTPAESVWSTVSGSNKLENHPVTYKYVNLPDKGWATWNLHEDYTTDISTEEYETVGSDICGLTYSTAPINSEQNVTTGRNWGNMGIFDVMGESGTRRIWDQINNRVIYSSEGGMECGPHWDWAKNNVRFDVYQIIRTGNADPWNWNFDRVTAGHTNNAESDSIGPTDREVGSVRFNLTLPAVMGGHTLSFTEYPRQIWLQGFKVTHLGHWIQKKNSEVDRIHQFKYAMEINDTYATMPSHALHYIHDEHDEVYRGWWRDAWSIGAYGSNPKDSPDMSVDPELIERGEHYTFALYNGIAVSLHVTAFIPIPGIEECRYVPDIRGCTLEDYGNLKYDDINDEWVPDQPQSDELIETCRSMGFNTAGLNESGTIDYINNAVTLMNTHENKNASFRWIHQLPVQGSIIPKHFSDPSRSLVGEFAVSQALIADVEEDPNYECPNLIGMTLNQAKAYLNTHFPDWEILEGEFVEEDGISTWRSFIIRQLCNYVQPGTIAAQIPDPNHRHKQMFIFQQKKIRICINEGLTAGKYLTKNITGLTYNYDEYYREELGLNAVGVELYTLIYWSGKQNNVIDDQLLPAQTVVPNETTSTWILISMPIEQYAEYPVPDLTGMTINQARDKYPEFIIVKGTEAYSDYNEFKFNTLSYEDNDRIIFNQIPKPIHRFATFPANIIRVALSRGKAPCDDQMRTGQKRY